MKKKLYKFFPKNINYLDSSGKISLQYKESSEGKKLKELIDSHIRNPLENIGDIIEAVKKNSNIVMVDASRLTMGDRAYNLQYNGFFGKEKFRPINFVISLLEPYYFCYVGDIDISQTNEFIPGGYKWLKNHGRNEKLESKKKFKKIIKSVSKEIEANLGYKKFSNKRVNKILEGVSHQDIPTNEFTYFNALFLNDFYSVG